MQKYNKIIVNPKSKEEIKIDCPLYSLFLECLYLEFKNILVEKYALILLLEQEFWERWKKRKIKWNGQIKLEGKRHGLSQENDWNLRGLTS